jgi:hypothetical protein
VGVFVALYFVERTSTATKTVKEGDFLLGTDINLARVRK